MFSTESKYGDLLVIVLPKQPPKVKLTSTTENLEAAHASFELTNKNKKDIKNILKVKEN